LEVSASRDSQRLLPGSSLKRFGSDPVNRFLECQGGALVAIRGAVRTRRSGHGLHGPRVSTLGSGHR
jgi:hypothetical protein